MSELIDDTIGIDPDPRPYRRTTLQQARSQETQRRLVRAGVRLFAQKGFDATTVEEICLAAEMSRSTFYFHFESKEQLLDELGSATGNSLAVDIEAVVGQGLDVELDAFGTGIGRRVEGMGGDPRHISEIILRRTLQNIGKPQLRPGDLEHVLLGIVERAIAATEVVPDVDKIELIAMLSAMTMDAIHRWTDDRTGGRGIAEILSLRFGAVLAGFRTGTTDPLRDSRSKRDAASPKKKQRGYRKQQGAPSAPSV